MPATTFETEINPKQIIYKSSKSGDTLVIKGLPLTTEESLALTELAKKNSDTVLKIEIKVS